MEEFIKNMQRFLAQIAITPSATRGERKPGVRAAIINTLLELPLADFANQECFAKNLEKWTDRLGTSCTPRVSFGTARKCLNIFLRDTVYNFYTLNYHKLCAIVPLLEVPLDGKVAKGIQDDLPNEQLPKWNGIVNLDWNQHNRYQCAAQQIACERYNTHRVHLDLRYFTSQPSGGYRKKRRAGHG